MDELLKITDLSVEYHSSGNVAKAVNHLNLTIYKGEALGLVGESGAGKTTTAYSIMGLLPRDISVITGGDIIYNGQSLIGLKEREMEKLRGKKLSMVFANPLSSLNPVFTVGHQIMLSLIQNKSMSKKEAEKTAAEMLQLVGIPEYRMKDYPHQFSGGQRQRIGIAAALISSPELLIADEPTTALDVTIQAQILELMKKLQKEFDSSLLMITHNLGIISELCQRVAIIYGGQVVEYGKVSEVFRNPMHWYTIGLLNAIPKLTGKRERLQSIPGSVANAQHLPEGCAFHPRCEHCTAECQKGQAEMVKINEDHFVRCWHYKDKPQEEKS